MKKLPKGKKNEVVKTSGRELGQFDLYDFTGLSLGQILCIRTALATYERVVISDPIARELVSQMKTMNVNGTVQPLDTNQTITKD